MNTLVDGLRILLASNFVLYVKTHMAHWNTKGRNFFSDHKMFEEQYINLWENVDVIAEKLRRLDADATVTPQEQLTLSFISCDSTVINSTGYIQSLFNDHNRMIILYNKIFLLAQAENNQADMNYFAERLDYHAKARWFLKSCLDRNI